MSISQAMTSGCVVDNMVLAMFVDMDHAGLLSDLAGGNLFVTPSIVDEYETPPFAAQPVAEFAKGAFHFQERLGNPLAAVRLHRRTAFYLDINATWRLGTPSVAELQLANTFVQPATWQHVRAIDPSRRVKRISRGEAECAAVAVTRGWALWTDDTPMIDLIATLHPDHPVERISDLLARAVQAGFLGCQEAADLYNMGFKQTLGLWTTRSLTCVNDQILIQ